MDGMLPIDEVKVRLDIRKLPGERGGNFQTLGGFVMNYLKRVPKTADHFECCGWRFEVVDMDRHRVDKVLIEAVDKEEPDPEQ
jgi:putative hemolysin